LSAKTLQDMGLPKVSHIITGWKEAGFPVEEWKPKEK
jgi:hypothetical protein